MADTKVTALTELTAVEATDLLYVVDDPAGTPLSKKATAKNIVKAGGWEFIASTVLGAPAASIAFSSIPAYPLLQLYIIGQAGAGGSANVPVLMIFNGDTGSNYYATHNDGTATAYLFAGDIAGTQSTPAVREGCAQCLIANKASAYKSVLARSNGGWYGPKPFLIERTGMWVNQSNAINAIALANNGGVNFVSGTAAYLFGMGVPQ